jgi:hypothetical protein
MKSSSAVVLYGFVGGVGFGGSFGGIASVV